MWLKRINWKNTIFLILTPLIGIGGVVGLAVNHQIHWATVLLGLVWLAATGLTITAGYHRLFAHQTYQAKPIVRWLFLLFGAAAFQGSVLEWCTDHRNHHRYTDTDKDPYNIHRGFWYAHIGWLFLLDTSQRNYSNVEDLNADPWIRRQHRFFTLVSLLMGFGIPMLIAGCWGDALGGLIIVGALRTAINHHFTFCINSVCHLWGKRKYSNEQTARDNWVTALFTYGEGFHNFHHQFPIDYRNGIRAYHYDPSKWLIRGLNFIGLASDLKKVGISHLTRYRLKTEEQLLLMKFKQRSEAVIHYVNEHLNPLRNRILQTLSRIEAMEKDRKIKEYREQLQLAQQELKQSLIVWSRLTRELLSGRTQINQ